MLRFAPSQTKDIHVGNLRVAIFNYIISKQLNEDLVVRIEDIDKKNIIEGKDKEILEILNLFAIEYKGGLHQSDSLKYHQKLAMQLMAQKNAFSCFCSDEKLQELKDEAKKQGKTSSYDGFCETLSDETVLNTNAPFTVRIKKPNENIKFTDQLNGVCEYTADEVDYFHILTHDKTPTYNYACALDDMIMNISTVIREDKYLADTARQTYIRNLLGYDKEINYIHIPTITDEQNNEISVKQLIDGGFLPSAIANYLVLLGNKTPNEIFTLEEAIEWFDIKNVSLDETKFDIEKLKEINKKHLQTIDDMRLSKILGFADTDIGKLAKLFLNDSSTIKELKEKVDSIFASKTVSKDIENEFNTIKECLAKAPYIESFEELKKYICEETKLGEEKVLKPLNVILTNNENVSNINDIYPLIKNYLGEIVK